MCLAAKFVKSCHCTVAFSSQVLTRLSCTDLHLTLLYISILRIFSKFLPGKTNSSSCARRVMLERWPQVCHIKITSEYLSNSWFVSIRPNTSWFVSKNEFCEMLCKMDSIGPGFARLFEPNRTLRSKFSIGLF